MSQSKSFALSQKRKERYEIDMEYKQKRLAQSREAYRQDKGIELFSCLDRIPSIGSGGWGAVRTVSTREGQSLGERMCLTMAEFGDIVGDHSAAVIYRWQSKGFLPDTAFTATVIVTRFGRGNTEEEYAQEIKVYLAEEAEVIMQILGEHQQQVRYFRKTDTVIHDRISAAVTAVRGNIGV